MMIGSYPCCNAPLMIELPAKTPAYCRELCPECGAAVWHLLSRVEPQSWTEAQFLAEYEVDEATKNVKPRNPEPFLLLTNAERDELVHQMVDHVLYGDST